MANKMKSTSETRIEETAPTEDEPVTEQEHETPTTEETAPTEDKPTTEQERETPTTYEAKSAEPLSEETHCPFEATVTVTLAVLRKNIGPGTAAMLKPVATLRG